MGNNLEQLLNSLIEKGWKPFGYENVYIETSEGEDFDKEGYVILRYKKGGTYEVVQDFRPYRFICMRESGLWQFVCENKMIPYDKDGYTWYERTKDYFDDIINSNSKMLSFETDKCYGYRLIESALKDESELEDFLLQNIKVDE